MSRSKGIKLAFIAFGKTRNAVELAQGVHLVAPSGEYFVRVGLMTHVPYQTVMGCIEYIVQCHRELDRTQVGA